VGGLDPRKGMNVILSAFAQVRDPAARLCLVGNGPLRPALEAQAQELGIGARVRFTGAVDAAGVLRELQRSRMLIMASRMDTSPNAVSEAHAVGLPVIGTRTGGIPEMIAEGVDGCLIPVDDASAMAGAMERLLADPELCRTMGRAGREKVRALNDPARIAREHYAFFREVVDGLPAARGR